MGMTDQPEPNKMYSVMTPHRDIENHVQRDPIGYYVDYPDQGINEDTGLIFSVSGIGYFPEMDYEKMLRRYLATKYNCLAVGVVYFGQRIKKAENIQLLGNFFENLEKHHGVSVSGGIQGDHTDLVSTLFQALSDAGIKKLHTDCRGYAKYKEEYLSFGFLPALDHLQTLHQIMREIPLNKNRIFAYGASYGGYIAQLLAKYAPNTFCAIIDNSGYVSLDDCPESIYGQNELEYVSLASVRGIELAVYEHSVWSKDPDSPHFLGGHCARIRNLLEADHLKTSNTHHYCYHYVDDPVVAAEGKIKLRDLLCNRATIDLTLVDDSQIDGRIYKEKQHCLGASYRDIFDLSYKKFTDSDTAKKNDHATDFDLGSEITFRCGKRDYHFAYSNQDGVRVSLTDP